jgi:hypothetical protein
LIKKRILHAIDDELTKWNDQKRKPDLLINIFTKEREKVKQTSLTLDGVMVGDGDGTLIYGEDNKQSPHHLQKALFY